MRITLPGLCIGLLLALLQTGARAESGLAVIVPPGHALTSLDAPTLAAIFRRKLRVSADGHALVPVNLRLTDPLRTAFSQTVFGLEPAAMDAYWNERYFHGVQPPHVVASVEAMLRFVAATDGAVGYVPTCRVDARVRQLMILPLPDGIPADCTAPARP